MIPKPEVWQMFLKKTESFPSDMWQPPSKVDRPQREMSCFFSPVLDKYACEAAARIRVDDDHRIRRHRKSCCVRDVTHCSRAFRGIYALVLSLMLKVLVLSVLTHTHTHSLILSHILLRCHTQSYLHILGSREASNSCLLWKTIFYSCMFHIAFPCCPTSTAA